jgi:hypothetical protein
MFIFSFCALYPCFHRGWKRKRSLERVDETAAYTQYLPISGAELVLGHAMVPHPHDPVLPPFCPYSCHYTKARIYLPVRIPLFLSSFSYISVSFFTIRNVRALIFFYFYWSFLFLHINSLRSARSCVLYPGTWIGLHVRVAFIHKAHVFEFRTEAPKL